MEIARFIPKSSTSWKGWTLVEYICAMGDASHCEHCGAPLRGYHRRYQFLDPHGKPHFVKICLSLQVTGRACIDSIEKRFNAQMMIDEHFQPILK